jgi:hypothetical protein
MIAEACFFHRAVLRGDINILPDAGADPNVIPKGGFTPKWRLFFIGLVKFITFNNYR